MISIEPGLRRLLEKATLAARQAAEAAARDALLALGVSAEGSFRNLDEAKKNLRVRLRAHARQLGDPFDPRTRKQEIDRLVREVAYVQWHRFLFARFLAENGFLVEPETGVALTLDECRDLARERGSDPWEFAAEFAAHRLGGVFRLGNPALEVRFSSEYRARLEKLLEELPSPVFQADDALGWVYQYWRKQEKEAVNSSGKKIGGETLPAVTQLFTEPYMVQFILHNTLGAWWVARHGKAPKGLTFEYLRMAEDGFPAAGRFEGWPVQAKDLRVLDPCCGSGHFLVALLHLLVPMREEEEGLSRKAAVRAVLRENLFGLEIDRRCSEIAAFSLVFAAWRMVGKPFDLPTLNLACSGLPVVAPREEWVKLAPGQGYALENLHALFSQAADLGSLINPGHAAYEMAPATLDATYTALETALAREDDLDPEAREIAFAARGLVQAARILRGRFHLVATNVPYLARGKQEAVLKDFIEKRYKAGKADLATAFVLRCLEFCAEGGTAALVTPQNWLFLGRYKGLRKDLLEQLHWHFVARLGAHAFGATSGEVVKAALFAATRAPRLDLSLCFGIEASDGRSPRDKQQSLKDGSLVWLEQRVQIDNPDSRIAFQKHIGPLLSQYAYTATGMQTFDSPRFSGTFWEFDDLNSTWLLAQTTVRSPVCYGGRSAVVRWENGLGGLRELVQKLEEGGYKSGIWKAGTQFWGKAGVLVSLMQALPATLYCGVPFDNNTGAIIPKAPELLPPIWVFSSSTEFTSLVRSLDNKLNVTNATIGKIPFDLPHWQKIAAEKYPHGLPEPYSNDPTQWLFKGRVDDTTEPLQVAVARLLGYRWPAELDPKKAGVRVTDDDRAHWELLLPLADTDGIVCLPSVRGEPTAEARLREVLAAGLGSAYSATKERELIASTGSKADSLADWLRDDFFAQHSKLFHQRPFIWHVWDGRKDGFHALLNYHKLAAPGGAGRRLLESLTYSYLGDWISRQREAARRGEPGADDRLAAALELAEELKKVLQGEPPYDIFVRWKPLAMQPGGWEPDLDDGVRMNIRPFLLATLSRGRKGAGILRSAPNIKWGKDRGREPQRPREEYPWFWGWDEKTPDWEGGSELTRDRWNDCHYTRAAKETAREGVAHVRHKG